MNAFVIAIGSEVTLTENGMKAFASTMDANTDLFYKIGAARGTNIIPLFAKAYGEDKETALRIAQWARDVRGGSGERELYRSILKHLESTDPRAAALLALKTPEIGRWDDLLVFTQDPIRKMAFEMINKAICEEGNGLAAKWMPRKGPVAVALRKYLNLSPKQYRKILVGLTNVVEQKMCAKAWDEIDFNKLPSKASSLYKTAFFRNAEVKYRAYVDGLTKGTSKINANAIYPYEILKDVYRFAAYGNFAAVNNAVIQAQWDALPNYLGDEKILAMVDVSGSMSAPVSGTTKVNAMDVAVSLGLYVADKLKGPFKDVVLTFSGSPQLLSLPGDIINKVSQLVKSEWGMNTDLTRAFGKVLDLAVSNKVPAEDMPTTILILSDMQFDQCAKLTGMEMIEKSYAAAGYKAPAIVFWNLRPTSNVPVRSDKKGVALVSGFSPAILKTILATAPDEMTPKEVMIRAVYQPRYDLLEAV